MFAQLFSMLDDPMDANVDSRDKIDVSELIDFMTLPPQQIGAFMQNVRRCAARHRRAAQTCPRSLQKPGIGPTRNASG